MQQMLILMSPDGKQIGTATREECHRNGGKLHWGFVLFITNSKGELLITKRAATKTCGAGLWDGSVVSHQLPNETVLDSMKRESLEEVGIAITQAQEVGHFIYTQGFGTYSENEYCSVYMMQSDATVVIDPKEVSESKWVRVPELLTDMKANPDNYAAWLTIPLEKFADKL